MLLYQLKSVYLNQCSSNGIMCFCSEFECQNGRNEECLCPCGEQQSRGARGKGHAALGIEAVLWA